MGRIMNQLIVCRSKSKSHFSNFTSCVRTVCFIFYMSVSFGLVAQETTEVIPPTPEDLLIVAVQKNQLSQVKKLLSEGADVNTVDPSGNSLLHLAVEKNSKPLLALLIEKGATIDARNSLGETPLYYSISKNKSTSFNYLIANNANIEIPNNENATPLFNAVLTKNLSYVKSLVEKGAVVSKPMGPEEIYPATLAYEARRIDILKVLLANHPISDATTGTEKLSLFLDSVEKNRKMEMEIFLKAGSDPNSKMPDGNPAIVTAIQKGYGNLIKPLLDAGVSVHSKDKDGKPLLLIAHENYVARINSARLSIVQILFDAKADPNTKTLEGKTLLQDYAERGWEGLAKKAIDSGADIHVVTKNNNQLIHLAARSGKVNLVNNFLNLGADVNATGDSNNTPLHIGTEIDSSSIVDALLKKGANPNLNNKKGETALTIAIQRQNLSIAKTLIQAGSDLKTLNSYGNPLLMELCSVDSFGMKASTFPILDVLLQNGADVNLANAYGNTCLSYALNRKNAKMFEYLLNKGADPNKIDSSSNSILHKAVRAAFYERLKNESLTDIFSLTIEYGGDVNFLDSQGMTPLHVASIQANNRDSVAAVQAMEVLLDYSANPFLKDRNGKTAYDYGKNNKDYKELLERFFSSNSDILPVSKDSILTPNRDKLKKISPEFGDAIVQDTNGSIHAIGRTIGELKTGIDKRCKQNENYVIGYKKVSNTGEEILQSFEGQLGSCLKTEAIDIVVHPSDESVYAGVLFKGKERNLYRITEEGEWIPIAKPAGNWEKIRLLPSGNFLFVSDRVVEVNPEGKIIKTSWPKKINGLKSFDVTDSGDFIYAGTRKTPKINDVIWVEKYKGNDRLDWRKVFGSNGIDSVDKLFVDKEDQIYILGTTTGELHGLQNPTGNTINYSMMLEANGRRLNTIKNEEALSKQ